MTLQMTSPGMFSIQDIKAVCYDLVHTASLTHCFLIVFPKYRGANLYTELENLGSFFKLTFCFLSVRLSHISTSPSCPGLCPQECCWQEPAQGFCLSWHRPSLAPFPLLWLICPELHSSFLPCCLVLTALSEGFQPHSE